VKAELPIGPGYWVWVVEVWDTEFVYEFETPEGTKLFRREYSVDDEGVAMLGEQTEVVTGIGFQIQHLGIQRIPSLTISISDFTRKHLAFMLIYG